MLEPLDKPKKAPHKGQWRVEELREISPHELKIILEKHKKWVQSKGKEGEQADLYNTNLHQVRLIGADLRAADLSLADLKQAKLMNANLQDALLVITDLRGAYLGDAKLQRAILHVADVEGANLTRADLTGASLDGVHNLAKAKLQDCNFERATGLKGTEFARADITGAKLPEDIREFKTLTIVEEVSKNARRIFLAMLLACAYSWLTIGSTTDVNLLTNSASSPLPIIRTAIPIVWFYLIAPILLIVFYFYLHLYLQRLWEGLAGLPGRFEDGKRLDERAYPWLLNGLVRRHFEILNEKRSLIMHLEEWVSIILAWWLVPFSLFCFWLRYIPRHDWTGTCFHTGLITVSIAAGIIFYRSHAVSLKGCYTPPYRIKTSFRDRRTYYCIVVILAGVILLGLSHGAINGIRGEGIPLYFKKFGYDVFADFYEKDVSTRPADYWLIRPEDRDSCVIGAQLYGADLRYANADGAFLVNANLRTANLEGAYLRFADLKGARLFEANLQGANLEYANLKGANLNYAHLQGAKLETAAYLTQQQLLGACGDTLTKLPYSKTIEQCPEEED